MSQMIYNVGKDTPHLAFCCFGMTEISDKEINSNYLLDSQFQVANTLNYTVFSLSQDPLYHNLWEKLLCHGAFRENKIKDP